MKKEYTNEELVTKLLVSNDLVFPAKKNYMSKPENNLGDYLKGNHSSSEEKPSSKYSFIDLSLSWL